MIRIAIVDDDKIIMSSIKQHIIDLADFDINIDSYAKSTDFFHEIGNLQYDIAFLDIDMPEISGFELAKMLNSIKPDITIIFVSNLKHLAFRAFEFKPFGFVRKDSLKDDLRYVIDLYKRDLGKKSEMYFFKTSEKNELSIILSDIIYFESMKHDIYVHTLINKYKIKRDRESEQSMRTLSVQFEQKGFVRVHKSFLVNCRYIYKVNQGSVELKNGMLININPHNIKDIKNKYQKFLMMEG